jgi:cytochrome c biogenesis protein CcdA
LDNTKTRTNYECSASTDFVCTEYTEVSECDIATTPVTADLTLPKIISLAAVDAINPCALAVLALMLIAILTYNPKKRSNVFWAGMAFIAAVFVMYIIYGLVIIRFFQLIQILTSVRLWIYKILGVAAIFLGFLNIKDFIKYKPGGALTEMPLFMRPKMKKVIESVTSPIGAFSTGLFVTVFLLPCTIGPYVIAGGILSTLELLATIPWLALYNIIFVVPMAVIVLMVYIGLAKVEDVSGWKDKNIRYLHLVAGAIMFILGLAMIMGWV